MPSLHSSEADDSQSETQELSSVRLALLGLLPSLMLAAFAFQLGTFPGAARADHAIIGHLLLFAVWISTLRALDWRKRLPLKAWVATLVGTLLLVGASLSSPVPRAGWTGLALLPAWASVPFWMAYCWRRPTALRWGLRGLAAVLASVSVWALVSQGGLSDGPAAMPLGHHNLLAAFLLPLLAIVPVLGSMGGGRGRFHPDRVLGIVSTAAGVVVLVATGSLAGGLALLVMASVAVLLKLTGGSGNHRQAVTGKRRVVTGAVLRLVGIALTLIAFQLDRIRSVLSGADSSLQARMTYWKAGLSGFWERPWWGWGPGSAHWTLAEHLEPRPGINPSGQVVADVHNFPLQMLYELGLLGCIGAALLITGLCGAARSDFVQRRRQPLNLGPLPAGAGVGLLGMTIFSLSGFSLDVPALPMALMPCVAVLLLCKVRDSDLRAKAKESRKGLPERAWILQGLGWSLLLVLAAWQGGRDLAHWYYDRAQEDESLRLIALQRALELDPHFPLYTWQLAQEEPAPELAWRAAEGARGLAVLWLTAGDQQESSTARMEAWLRSSDLDPLSAPAYFRLAVGGSPPDVGTQEGDRKWWAVKALLLEPLLVAAVPWSKDEGFLLEVAEELAENPALDIYWRRRLLDLVLKRSQAIEPRTLGLKVDAVPSESLSLFAFRRQPWPRIVTRVALDPELASKVDLYPDPVAADRIRSSVE